MSKSFVEKEARFEGHYSSTVFRTLYQAYRPFLWKMVICLLLGLLGRALLLGNANLIGHWVDAIANQTTSADTAHDYLTWLVAMTTGGFISTLIFRVGFSRLSAQAVSRVYDEVTLRTSRFPLSFFDQTPTGRIITRFSSDYGNVFRLFGGPLAEFLGIIFDLLCMVALLTYADPLYLGIVVVVVFMNYMVWRSNRDNLRKNRRELSALRSPSISHFAETAQGASTIRSFNKEENFETRFLKLDGDYLRQKLHMTSQIVIYSFKMNSLTAVMLLLTGIAAYFWLEQGWVTIGSVGVAFGFITLSGTTVQMFFEWMSQFEEALVGMERLDQYLHKPLEQGAHLPAESQFQTPHPRAPFSKNLHEDSPFRHARLKRQAPVSIRNLWFRYRDDMPFVLKGLNLEIKAGERLGVVGRTGSGKSSLIQALFYLYPHSEGEIRIENLKPQVHLPAADDSNPVDLMDYRKSISFISQESIMFQGTLRENLDIIGNTSDDRMLEALARVGLEEWSNLQSLEMTIEEKGRNLSLGEKQLICMARCLLQNSPLVVMDEATSSVDPQSEEILVKATEEIFSGRTQIIIAHRLSTLKRCDRILWLDQGEVKMLGTPEEVLPSFENQ